MAVVLLLQLQLAYASQTAPFPAVKHQGHLSVGEHFAQLKEFRLHYYVKGNGPLMLAPTCGWGPAVNYMMPLGDLEKHFTIVYFDTRHSGKSTGPSDPMQYKLENFVADIESFRAYLGQGKVFLAGHSAGGHMALAYAVEHSSNLNGVISIDAIAAMDSLWSKEMHDAVINRASRPYFKAHPAIYQAAYNAMFGQDRSRLSPAEKISATRVLFVHNPLIVEKKVSVNEAVYAYTQKSGFQTKNLLPELSQIKVPVLVISGDDDWICGPESQARRIHEAIENSTLEIIKESGHRPWEEQPAAFNEACARWIKQLGVQ